MTLLELGRLTSAAMAAPCYVVFRREQPERLVPTYMAAAHKMLAGIFGVTKNMLIALVALGADYVKVPAVPESILEFAESSGMLVGDSGMEVCAGPPSMAAEALQLLTTGNSKTRANMGPASAHLVSCDEFLDYAAVTFDMTVWYIIFALRTQELYCYFHGILPGMASALSRGIDLDGIGDDWIGRDNYSMLAGLEPAAANSMVAGVQKLFLSPESRGLSGPLFQSDYSEEYIRQGEDICRWLTSKHPQMDDRVARSFGFEFARCLATERQALDLFNTLALGVMSSLDWRQTEPLDSRATVAAVFGALPSDSIARLLGVDMSSLLNELGSG